MEPYDPTDEERAELASQLEIAKQEWEEDMQFEEDQAHYPLLHLFGGETDVEIADALADQKREEDGKAMLAQDIYYATDFDYIEDYA
tara:strand:+ start:674 stop:934 length:261 start_codon:yes stop_codon:yes gene_type:complete